MNSTMTRSVCRCVCVCTCVCVYVCVHRCVLGVVGVFVFVCVCVLNIADTDFNLINSHQSFYHQTLVAQLMLRWSQDYELTEWQDNRGPAMIIWQVDVQWINSFQAQLPSSMHSDNHWHETCVTTGSWRWPDCHHCFWFTLLLQHSLKHQQRIKCNKINHHLLGIWYICVIKLASDLSFFCSKFECSEQLFGSWVTASSYPYLHYHSQKHTWLIGKQHIK